MPKKSMKPQAVDKDSWQDDDKIVRRKQQRREEKLSKQQEIATRKAENKLLLEQEDGLLKSGRVAKLTRAQIGSNSRPSVKLTLPENCNRIVDGASARSVDEAIKILDDAPGVDKHPEKRRKAAFLAFESRRLKQLKTEKPQLKLSQLKEIVFKEWQKAPENPMNFSLE
ncbi:coiled-coil domain-containing protein 124-like [Tribolium madens]|uniref:coiled-coil domain-containing protein 124-like n=1 Tax=Tribolium madens TaxID=41895 RepID=UPI001CF73BB0|nr:coiled-coil domain-containing protein 124-like [Tribolium madens]